MSEPDTAARRPSTVGLGAIVGVAAAGAGVAVGELAAAASRSLVAPVVSIGEWFIDLTPAWLKDLAIDWFGTDNKRALLVGIYLVLAVVAAVVGVQTLRRGWRPAVVGAGALGAVGMFASWRGPSATWWHALPALAAGIVAGASLVGLRHLALRPVVAPAAERPHGEPMPAKPAPNEPPLAEPMRVPSEGLDRRRLLLGSLALGVAAAGVGSLGRTMQQRFSTAAERAVLLLPRPRRARPAPPADPAVGVDGLSPLFTPNQRFFRIDTALAIPSVPAESWRLRIHGLVQREVVLTFDELLAMPMIEADITLSCVSNEVGGELVGNARWLGVRLDELLERAGVDPNADQIVGRSVDGFTAGFPTATLDGRDALVAVGMNGEPLPARHGYPARLVVPGLYGYVSATKWLSEIELTRFDRFAGYWIPRGWSREGPIKTQSRIDRPGNRVAASSASPIAGVAWAPHLGIERVEVQIDDGAWQEATLGPSVGDDSWRQWWLEWTPTPGQHTVRSRATDGTGHTQVEERTPVAPDGATGWHTRRITVLS